MLPERSLRSREFINEDSKSPKVNQFGVAQPERDFRGIVEDSAGFRLRLLLANDNFSQPKISKFHVPIFENNHIFGLQIAIHYLVLVQVLNRQDHTPSDELNPVLPKLSKLLNSQIFARVEVFIYEEEGLDWPADSALHHEIDVSSIFEGEFERGDEGVFEVGKDELFKLRVLLRLLIRKVFLSDALHGVVLGFPLIFLPV